MKNDNFIDSLDCAFNGLVNTYAEERNFRFHVFAASNIIYFAFGYQLDRVGFAILFLTIAFVLAAELFNTAVERAVDTATDEYSKVAELAKDAAAAGTLVAALASVAVGICLFGDWQRILQTLQYLVATPFNIILLVLFEFFNVLLIIMRVRK